MLLFATQEPRVDRTVIKNYVYNQSLTNIGSDYIMDMAEAYIIMEKWDLCLAMTSTP